MKNARPPEPPEPPFSVRIPFLHLEKEGVTRLTLVRHAQQAFPIEEEFDHSAWADPPLSELGYLQAATLAETLSETQVDVVACSTMLRAIETADILARPHGLTPVVRPELMEIKAYRDVAAGLDPQSLVDPAEWAARQEMFHREVKWDHMFFGEGSAEFRARAVGAVNQLVEDYSGAHILLVSHGGVINAVIGSILGVYEDMFFLPNHCSISSVWVKGSVQRIHSVNERQHLHSAILTN